MNKTLRVSPHGKGFVAQFQSATIYLCIHQMIELLQDICKNDRHLFDLSFFQFLHGKPQHVDSVVEYRIFFWKSLSFADTQRSHRLFGRFVVSKSNFNELRVHGSFQSR